MNQSIADDNDVDPSLCKDIRCGWLYCFKNVLQMICKDFDYHLYIHYWSQNEENKTLRNALPVLKKLT